MGLPGVCHRVCFERKEVRGRRISLEMVEVCGAGYGGGGSAAGYLCEVVCRGVIAVLQASIVLV